jgi:hypothetical protein
MDINNIFLQASRARLRFPSVVGQLTIEDLWDLPLTAESPKKPSLENIGAPLLARQNDLTKLRGESILSDATAPSAELVQVTLQVSILREVARIRQEENKARTVAAAAKSERDRLDALIQGREEKELPLEELKKRRESLG